MTQREPLAPEALRRRSGPEELRFDTTDELEPLEQAIGQDRALEATRFGLTMKSDGWNLFVIGSPGVGRRTLLRRFIEDRAASAQVPQDICYVQRFDRPEQPRALLLPAGRGRALRKDLERLVAELRTVLPQAFEADEFRGKKQAIEQSEKEAHEGRLEALKASAESRGLVVAATPVGFAIAPAKGDEILPPNEFEALPEAERDRLTVAMDATRKELTQLLDEVPRWQKRVRDQVRELARETATTAVEHVMEELRALWSDEPSVLAHLDALEHDVLDNADDFLKPPEQGAEARALGQPERRYQVNVLVDNAETTGAPVVSEDHATHANLIGRVEHQQLLGALVTDFHLLKPGALHRANGGYLLLDARDVLTQAFSWDALKRALRSRELRVESPAQSLGLVSTVTVEPEVVPLDVKVVLFGEPSLFELLDRVDPDLRLLFKVIVDFEDEIPRTPDNCLLYARLLASLARKEELPPLARSAVARLVEASARHAGDASKLSTHVIEAFDLVREAALSARQRGAAHVEAEDVDRAVRGQESRSGRVRERLLERTVEGTMLIDTAGERVGQVNGLSVIEIGRVSFGRPMRITAKVRLGRGDVIDVEREVELGGPLHSKGVLILSSFLAARYAPEHPLSLSATLVFEQSYGMVEGDSASLAELCALLSALSDVPIRQGWAMTGSVNQHGEAQPIGGANEKIEGFFDLCAARGLTGDQGVILPESNVRHLMLRDDVVDAVRAGRFRIVPVSTVDEAIELLTGVEAGERGAGGRFAEGSLNAKVEARLVALATRRIEIGRFDKS